MAARQMQHGYATRQATMGSCPRMPPNSGWQPTLTTEMRSMPKAAEISATYTGTVGAAGDTHTDE
jgi:hypothetical protein